MSATFNLDHVSAGNGRIWAEGVDPTVNRLSLINLGRLTNIGGTANAIEGRLSLSTGFTAIGDNSEFTFVPTVDNTGAVTMQLKDSTGASNLGAAFALRSSSGLALTASALKAGAIYRFHYNSTEGYARMIAPASTLVKGRPNALLYHGATSGTSGGATTSGSWLTRTLNTEYDPDNVITLSANQFVPLYTGWVRWWSTIFDPADHASRLYNVTDAAIVTPVGTSGSGLNSSDMTVISHGSAPVLAGKTYRLEYRVGSANANGQGSPRSWGDELYAMLEYFVDPF